MKGALEGRVKRDRGMYYDVNITQVMNRIRPEKGVVTLAPRESVVSCIEYFSVEWLEMKYNCRKLKNACR